ncbi:hypothetical protein [Heyndrickxia sporothermodurans]|uniref:hypothetical protein n=1 Tax=Heyndrickxia sporothermodurans TaxID=46224 RepID=UPI000D3D1F88|nr:hypothetical protein [Heyndrickxia sporothermodurans]PTY93007.1 hypothetical protein B5V90_02690 [Heyndrickxia sporothermodurans]
MKYGDEYRHYKGGHYRFLGIAFPVKSGELSAETQSYLTRTGTARYHENTHDINLFMIDGAYFIDSDVPHVIYQSEKDYQSDHMWAREVDDFFGYILSPEGNFVRRFAKVD